MKLIHEVSATAIGTVLKHTINGCENNKCE